MSLRSDATDAITTAAADLETFTASYRDMIDAVSAALGERITTTGHVPVAIDLQHLKDDLARVCASGGCVDLLRTPSPLLRGFLDRSRRSVIVPFQGNRGQFFAAQGADTPAAELETLWEAAVAASADLNPAIEVQGGAAALTGDALVADWTSRLVAVGVPNT